MAVTVTAGSYSADVATDDAGASGHAQIIKLAISTGGSATLIPADAAQGLDVDVTRVQSIAAGDNNIGNVDIVTLPALPTGANTIGTVNVGTACDLGSILEGGTQKAIVRGGAKGGTAAADVTSTVVDANHQALDVAIVSGGAVGGTSSNFGAAFPSAGTAIGGSDGTNMIALRAKTTAALGCDPGMVVRPVGFITPNGDSMVDDTLNGLGIVLLNQLASDQDEVSVTGLVAHDAAVSSNAELRPLVQGFRATSALSGLTLTADADVTWGQAGLDGVQIMRPHTGLEDIVTGNVSNTGGGCDSLIAAQGAGVKVYLTRITVTNAHATTFAYAEITSGNKVKHTIPVPPAAGATIAFDPPLPPDAANLLWGFDPSAAVTTLYCSAVGFKSKV